MMPRQPLAIVIATLVALSSTPHQADGQYVSSFGSPFVGSLFNEFNTIFDNEYAHRFPSSTQDVVLLGVGCTPIQTLHKSVQHADNETIVSLYVSKTCSAEPSKVSLKDPQVHVDPVANEVLIQAAIDGQEDDILVQRVYLDGRADLDKISASYDEASQVFKVTIAHKAGEKRDVAVTMIPARSEDKETTSHTKETSQEQAVDPPVATVSLQTKSDDNAEPRSNSEGTQAATQLDEVLAKKIKALEAELARIKGMF